VVFPIVYIRLYLVFFLLHSPSSTADQLSQHADNEYLHAEQVGKSGQPCDQVFSDCSESILDIFSGVYDPVEEFLQMMG
jgi:DM4/DM12 family